jgi:hypothetical protein
MANCQECIPEPAPRPSHPSPHALTPPGWDESAGFRETFLRHVTDAEDDRTLRHLARMLHEATLELAHFAPPSGESATREELRAAAADLRHLQGFLATVARTVGESELPPDDAELAGLAARQAEAVAGLAEALEQALEQALG